MEAATSYASPVADALSTVGRRRSCRRHAPNAPRSVSGTVRSGVTHAAVRHRGSLATGLLGAELGEVAHELCEAHLVVGSGLLALRCSAGLGRRGQMRSEGPPPTMIELGPLQRTQERPAFGHEAVVDEWGPQPLGIAPERQAQEVEDALFRDGVVTREVVELQRAPHRDQLVEHHRCLDRRLVRALLVVDRHERGQPVGHALLEARHRDVQDPDQDVAHLVAEGKLAHPDEQALRGELGVGEDRRLPGVGDRRLRGLEVLGEEERREPDGLAIGLRARVRDASRHRVGHTDMDVIGQGEAVVDPRRHALECTGLLDDAERVQVLRLRPRLVIDDLHAPVRRLAVRSAVVATRAADEPAEREQREARDACGCPEALHGSTSLPRGRAAALHPQPPRRETTVCISYPFLCLCIARLTQTVEALIWIFPRSMAFLIRRMMPMQRHIPVTTVFTFKPRALHDCASFLLPFWMLELCIVTGSLGHFYSPGCRQIRSLASRSSPESRGWMIIPLLRWNFCRNRPRGAGYATAGRSSWVTGA